MIRNSKTRRLYGFPRLVLTALLAALGGCSSLAYYHQAALGQMEIWHRSRPVPRVLAEIPQDSELARRLRLSQEIRDFASRELALPDNGSYRSYADLERPYAVWTLVAAPELSLEARQWCYPLVGCLAYRGYFQPGPARQEAQRLQQAGWDTHVGGVLAYSTLGWFRDPLLNTFWQLDDVALASLLIHELAHQVVFVPHDTTFNESFATAVELQGTERWLLARQGREQADLLRLRFQRRQEVAGEVRLTAERLRQLYDSDLSREDKLEGKERLLAELRERYLRLRGQWGRDAGFDGWFQQPLNNAHILLFNNYYEQVPAFLEQIRRLEGDLPAFYRWAQRLARRPKPERDAILAGLAREGAP